MNWLITLLGIPFGLYNVVDLYNITIGPHSLIYLESDQTLSVLGASV